MADPAGVARVGDLGEGLDQRQRDNRRGARVEGDLRVIEGGNDRGHYWCGNGLPDLIKDLDTLMITSGPVPAPVPIMVCRRRSATAQRDFASALLEALHRNNLGYRNLINYLAPLIWKSHFACPDANTPNRS